MPQGMDEFTEKIYKKFLKKLQSDEETPAPLIDEIKKLMANGHLADSEAVLKAYESQEENHAKD